MKWTVPVLSLLAAAALGGCYRGPYFNVPYAGSPPGYPYSPYGYPPGSPPPAPSASEASSPAPVPPEPPPYVLPDRPGPFGLLAQVKLGQPVDEVKAISRELVVPGGEKHRGTDYKADIESGRVVSMRITFDHDATSELVARWGQPVADGAMSAWLDPDSGLRVVLEEAGWSLRIAPYLPLARLIGSDGGKLKGIVADVLSMDRKAFDARYPGAKVYKLVRDVALEVPFPPVEATLRATELEAVFSPSGALVSVELSVGTGVTKGVDAVLTAVHGPPRELPLCPPAKKPCSIVSGIYQADPVTRYGKSALEVTTWPHDWAVLTVRWSRKKTRTDFFSTFTPPDRVHETE